MVLHKSATAWKPEDEAIRIQKALLARTCAVDWAKNKKHRTSATPRRHGFSSRSNSYGDWCGLVSDDGMIEIRTCGDSFGGLEELGD